ncbi:MAG: amidohydrolase family protein [Gammaproteobacteria bacterium]|nr:amidohydrolase family protein [Gammaproteobacteria bacterium]
MLRRTLVVITILSAQTALANDELPIADAHVHYSHDSVELTPPERVIELMREANLKFALVSSSDDNGTQLLSELAPDLIVPGLRPYRRRGETGTWFTDPDALAYVETLLEKNRYATIGEFHLYGSDADLDIPRRIVELADAHNLILHAHSDADAVTRLLAQSPTVKVIWAHSGFESPPEIAEVLRQHERLWADLAFRSDVGSGGSLSADWVALFEEFPDRLMLGTDTYTPERMYFLPDHAASSRVWLNSLPSALAKRVAWQNAYDLLMPVWNENRLKKADDDADSTQGDPCRNVSDKQTIILEDDSVIVRIETPENIEVSKPFPVNVTVCGDQLIDTDIELDAAMPAHGHGMNYAPNYQRLESSPSQVTVRAEGLLLHMPGNWQWQVHLLTNGKRRSLTHDFAIR